MSTSIRTTIVVGLLGLAAATGCRPFKLKAPAGFAAVQNDEYGAHMKGSDNVGLKVSVFDNVDGGTLSFWGQDLVGKLSQRGYVLQSQTSAVSHNGVTGTRFNFEYTAPGTEQAPSFFSAVLFATDRNIIVVQLAGKAEHYSKYAARVDEIAQSTKTRGCKARSQICKSEQPEVLTAVATVSPPADTP